MFTEHAQLIDAYQKANELLAAGLKFAADHTWLNLGQRDLLSEWPSIVAQGEISEALVIGSGHASVKLVYDLEELVATNSLDFSVGHYADTNSPLAGIYRWPVKPLNIQLNGPLYQAHQDSFRKQLGERYPGVKSWISHEFREEKLVLEHLLASTRLGTEERFNLGIPVCNMHNIGLIYNLNPHSQIETNQLADNTELIWLISYMKQLEKQYGPNFHADKSLFPRVIFTWAE